MQNYCFTTYTPNFRNTFLLKICILLHKSLIIKRCRAAYFSIRTLRQSFLYLNIYHARVYKEIHRNCLHSCHRKATTCAPARNRWKQTDIPPFTRYTKVCPWIQYGFFKKRLPIQLMRIKDIRLNQLKSTYTSFRRKMYHLIAVRCSICQRTLVHKKNVPSNSFDDTVIRVTQDVPNNYSIPLISDTPKPGFSAGITFPSSKIKPSKRSFAINALPSRSVQSTIGDN